MTKRRDFLVGMVFIGAIVGVGYMTVVIRGCSYTRLKPLTITFPDVLALEEGEQVRAKGVEVGQVQAVDYRSDGKVDVVVTLFKDPKLREGCTFRIRSKSPLGGKYVSIDPGPAGNPRAKATHFEGEQPTDLFSELEEVLGEKREHIERMIDNLTDTTQALRDGKGPLGALIYNQAMRDNLIAVLEDVTDAVTGDAPKGLLHTILHDRPLAANVRDIVGDVREALRRDDTLLGIVLKDAETGRSVKETLTSVAAIARDIRAGKGSVGRLFADDLLYKDAVKLVESLTEAIEGDGVIAYLLRDPESRKDVREVLKGLRELVVKLNEGDGTIAQLVNTSELHDELRKLLILSRETVEDAREQAPINQLVNMLGAVY